jgi:chromate transporter
MKHTKNKSISITKLFIIFLRLGCTSFGGPIAHIGFFHQEFVTKRRWYSEDEFLQIVALCQFLPGPASSQVGMALGLNARGYLGSITSFIAFTLPSALIMMTFAFLVSHSNFLADSSILYTLKLVAVAVVSQAIWSMCKSLNADTVKIIITISSTTFALFFAGPFTQIIIIFCAGLAGLIMCKHCSKQNTIASAPANKKLSILLIALFISILVLSPFFTRFNTSDLSVIFDSFYRAGALVFGGGHVVLPLLENELVKTGFISNEEFLYGYSLAQAIPGPLFTFSTYLGALSANENTEIVGAIIATLAIFLPGYLLVVALLPYWQTLRQNVKLNKSIAGINASVIGLLIASFINPITMNSISSLKDIVITLCLLAMLMLMKISPFKVIMVSVFTALLFDLCK